MSLDDSETKCNSIIKICFLSRYLKECAIKYTTTTNQVNVNLSDSCVKVRKIFFLKFKSVLKDNIYCCEQKLKEIKDPKKFLRVSVESGGCSGFEYKFNIDTKVESNQDM